MHTHDLPGQLPWRRFWAGAMACISKGGDAKVDASVADAFRHIALLYGGPAEYLLGVGRFIRAGWADDEPILVAVPWRNGRLLRRELGGESAHLVFADMTELGRNPARIIPEILDFARSHHGRRTRCIAEPAWPGRSAVELAETTRHETLANLAFRETPATILCPYGTADLPSSVIADAIRTHPSLVSEGREQASTRFSGRAANQSSQDSMLSAPPGHADSLDYGPDLKPVRRFVATCSRQAGLAAEYASDLVIAVSELAANTLRHTAGGGTVTLWHTEVHVICQIQDTGLITDPLVGHRLPPADVLGGKGLWLVNQLCDLVQRWTSPAGTVTRLHMRLSRD